MLPELHHKEYDKLREKKVESIGLDGITIEDLPIDWLQELDPDRLLSDDWDKPVTRGMRIEFLNVVKPYMYRNRNGAVLIILPEMQPPTYELFDSIWPEEKEIWGYVLRESHYGDMDEAGYWFLYGNDEEDGGRKLPVFDLKDGSTH